MNPFQLHFLELYRNAVNGRGASDPGFSKEEWTDLIHVAHMQEILPLLYDACFAFPSFKSVPADARKSWKDRALSDAVCQITQTNEFLTLILHAQAQGIDPIVLKGIICRSLYPQPYLRPSVDEDVLIAPAEAASFHSFLLSEGLASDISDLDPDVHQELSYHRENSPTYIEVHKTLFDPDSDVFVNFNEIFSGAMERTVSVRIEDVSVRTLAPTDHLLYLILHAFKHFVYSGIGIRAVCDIGLFAEHYAEEIEWEHVRKCLEGIQAFDFASALLHIVQQYLLPDALFFGHIEDWKMDAIDVEPLLEDILAGGVHGNSSIERLHSSNITLRAVAQEKKTNRALAKVPSISSPGFLRSAFHAVFLPLKKMAVRYPYLKKAPFLLPLAWVQRVFKYLGECIASRSDHKGSAAESMNLGQSRVELLKKYGIIR